MAWSSAFLLVALAFTGASAALYSAPLSNWTLSSSAAPQLVYNVTVPCTIVGCLVALGVYENIYYGDNLAKIDPGLFNVSWWYNISYTIPPGGVPPAGGGASLEFRGLNYRANVYVNGALAASNATVVGAFVYSSIDVSAAAFSGRPIAIGVEVFPQHDRSLPASNHDLDLG